MTILKAPCTFLVSLRYSRPSVRPRHSPRPPSLARAALPPLQRAATVAYVLRTGIKPTSALTDRTKCGTSSNHLALISPQQITAIPRCLQVSRVTLRRIPPIRRATATTPVQAPSFLRGQIEGQLERAGERRDSGMAERGGAEEIAVLLSSDARRSGREAASTATRPAQ